MSVKIEHVTFDDVSDGRLVLGNACAARMLTAGSDWTRIRIACRMVLGDTGANITGQPYIWMGLLSNPTSNLSNGPLGSTTSHFVGIRSYDSTFIRAVGATGVYYSGVSGNALFARVVKRITATDTVIATGITFGRLQCGLRGGWIIDVTKGSPNWSVQSCNSGKVSGSWPAMRDLDFDDLVAAMEISLFSGMANFLGADYTASAVGAVAVDEEANGPLNSICIAWNRNYPPAHFSEILISYFPS